MSSCDIICFENLNVNISALFQLHRQPERVCVTTWERNRSGSCRDIHIKIFYKITHPKLRVHKSESTTLNRAHATP